MNPFSTEQISTYLWNEVIPKSQMEYVLKHNEYARAELYPEFLGFMDIYYSLSNILPKSWTIIDIGCGYNAQSWLFDDFYKYISINPDTYDYPIFSSTNCLIIRKKAGDFIKNTIPELDLDLDKTFCICNYVPDWHGESPMKLVKKTFKNLYTFYP